MNSGHTVPVTVSNKNAASYLNLPTNMHTGFQNVNHNTFMQY